jgi:hypothetical protein
MCPRRLRFAAGFVVALAGGVGCGGSDAAPPAEDGGVDTSPEDLGVDALVADTADAADAAPPEVAIDAPVDAPPLSSSTVKWYRASAAGYVDAQDVAVASDGSVVVTGFFEGNADLGDGAKKPIDGYADAFTTKYDATGKHVWTRRVNGSGSSSEGHQSGESVAVDKAGNVYVAGHCQGTIDLGKGPQICEYYDSAYLVKYGPDGATLWSKVWKQGAFKYLVMQLDDAANVYVAGSLSTDGVDLGGGVLKRKGYDDSFLAKFDADGKHVFSRELGNAGQVLLSALAVNGKGEIAIAGTFSSTMDFGGGVRTASKDTGSVFVVRYDATGAHVFSQSFDPIQTGSLLKYADVGGLAFVAAGADVVLTGSSEAPIMFGATKVEPGAFRVTFSSLAGTPDPKTFATGDVVYPATEGIASGPKGLTMVGWFKGAITFGGHTLTAKNDRDAFLIREGKLPADSLAYRYGSADGLESLSGAAMGGDGSTFVCGYLGTSVDFGDLVTPATDGGVFLVAFAP